MIEEMREYFSLLFSGYGYMPRVQCGHWTPSMLRFYVASDITIALAYFAIPLCIAWAYRKYGRSTPLPAEARLLSALFGLFIVACGLTHAVDSVIFIVPLYRLQTLVLALTAACSVATAVVAPRVIRRLGDAQQTIEEQQSSIEQYRSDVESLNRKLSTTERFVAEYIRTHGGTSVDAGSDEGGSNGGFEGGKGE